MSRRQSTPSNMFYRKADPNPPLFPPPNVGDFYYNTLHERIRIYKEEADSNPVTYAWQDLIISTEGEGGSLDQATADARYVNITGDTMTGGLVITNQGAIYGLDVGDIHVRSDGIQVDDGGITLDYDWLTINSENTGGLFVYAGFEVWHDTVSMPNRSVGFWRSSGGSALPLMAAQPYEPVTKAFGDATYAAINHTHPGSADFRWVYDSPSTMANPGSGKIRTDTASGVPSTQAAISIITNLGIDASQTFASLTIGDLIYFQQLDNANNWGRYTVSGTPVNNTTWWLFPITPVEQHGSAIAKNQEVLVRFTYGTGGGGGTSTSNFLVLGPSDAVPDGTPVGTVIVRTETPIGPPAAPTVVASGSATGTSSLNVPVPAGTVAGDLLVTFISSQSTAIISEFAIPSGWTRVGWSYVNSETDMRYNAAFTHTATGSEPATYPWSNAVTTSRLIGVCVAVRGAAATSPVSAYAGPTSETNAALPKIPVVTVPSESSLLLGYTHTVSSAGADGSPIFGAPWTQVILATNPVTIAGAANDAVWVGKMTSNAGSAGGQIGSVVSGAPAADASAVLVIKPV